MSEIAVQFTASGGLAALAAGSLSLLLYPATELESGPCQLWLRVRDRSGIRPHPLTGPASGSRVGAGGVHGRFGPLSYLAWFDVLPGGYAWLWQVRNEGDSPCECDTVFTQDVALTPWDDLRRNEYYVSQYLDLAPLETSLGTALGVRQNMPGSGHPWLGIASLTGTAGWLTDALQLHDPAGGLDLARDLPGRRLQHEHTLAGLQSPAVVLAPGQSARGGFVAAFVAAHPDATGEQDARLIEEFVARGGWRTDPPQVGGPEAVPTIFSPAEALVVRDATGQDAAALAGAPLTLLETGPQDRFWSAFAGEGHVVALAKERAVLRPHGHLMHLSPTPLARADSTASTAWMAGVFASQLTHGHASGSPSLSLRRSYAGLSLAGGVRVAVRVEGRWRLLVQPTLWVQRPLECVWHYLCEDLTVRVSAFLISGGVRLEVACDPATDVLIAVGEGTTPVDLSPGFGDDAALFADGTGRALPWRCLVADATAHVAVDLRVPGAAAGPVGVHSWRLPRLSSRAAGVAELDATLAWFAHDAAVHYQAPRGLEQFTGGAWGTRDVCQGPVGLLLATGEHAALRATLLLVFAGQQDDGDWPQWFDYLPGAASPGHRDSHGDVVYWPLLALGEYLQVTGDRSILAEPVRWVGAADFLPATPIRDHLRRAVSRLAARRTRDARLPAYGHGDWNDSLQPARPELARQMCSTWTTELEIEALRILLAGLAGAEPALAAELEAIVAKTLTAFDEVLLVDGELTGYAVIDDRVDLLVHPRDRTTGLTHGALQMIHAISGELLTAEQARRHAGLIDAHLQGPHGIFLFDSPVGYSGGRMRVFKRAEAASYWGREIALMYTHAELRWIEALTHLGEAGRAWTELMKVVPAGIGDRIPGARPRQSTCYFSSADAAFPDRYEAGRQAAALFDPATPVEGGWRVYSSGSGLVLRLVTERLLGIRFRAAGVEVDPVLPVALDGLVARVPTPDGGFTEVTYRVGAAGHGVQRVLVDGRVIGAEPLTARYRRPGVRIAPDAVGAGSRVRVELG